MNNSKSQFSQNILILKSVFGKVGQTYYINPAKNKYGQYPDCVKKVDSNGDMILSDEERNDPNRQYFIPENTMFKITDGQVFHLDADHQYEWNMWEAIKNCPFIAPSRFAKDANGNYLIDGTPNRNALKQRYGVAELYVDMPGVETATKISRKKKIHKAAEFIFNDERGTDGRLLMARLLGKHMSNMPDSDVTDYLLSVAEKQPDKIIDLYTGGDTNLRILFADARDRKVILIKNRLYVYGDSYVLGATDEAVIEWMKNPKNKNVLKLIQEATYPDFKMVEKVNPNLDKETTPTKEVDPVIENTIKAAKNK